MALETTNSTKTLQMVYGENYIGYGLHFKNGDIATVPIAIAKNLLTLKTATGHSRFILSDPELTDTPVEEVKVARKVPQNPRTMRSIPQLREWLKERGISTPVNSSLETLKAKIPKDYDATKEVEEPIKEEESDIIVE